MQSPVQLQIGTAASQITPPLGVELAGYGIYRQRRAAAVRDGLSLGRAVLHGRCDVAGAGEMGL